MKCEFERAVVLQLLWSVFSRRDISVSYPK